LIRKAVITAAGTGIRLLPATKELAKEMLPLISQTKDGQPILKPMLQSVYESPYDFGIKNFCFIIERNRRSVEDHFFTIIFAIPSTIISSFFVTNVLTVILFSRVFNTVPEIFISSPM